MRYERISARMCARTHTHTRNSRGIPCTLSPANRSFHLSCESVATLKRLAEEGGHRTNGFALQSEISCVKSGREGKFAMLTRLIVTFPRRARSLPLVCTLMRSGLSPRRSSGLAPIFSPIFLRLILILPFNSAPSVHIVDVLNLAGASSPRRLCVSRPLISARVHRAIGIKRNSIASERTILTKLVRIGKTRCKQG